MKNKGINNNVRRLFVSKPLKITNARRLIKAIPLKTNPLFNGIFEISITP